MAESKISLQQAQKELDTIVAGRLHGASFARQDYAEEHESNINDIATYFLTLRHAYKSMQAYFDSDAVALPGTASFFATKGKEALAHGLNFMEYNTMRGGKVKLGGVERPDSEYANDDKGAVLYALELALSMEKLGFAKLRKMHKKAQEIHDPELQDFLNTKLHQQALSAKELANYIAEMHRVAHSGHGEFHFDRRIAGRHGQVLSAVVQLTL